MADTPELESWAGTFKCPKHGRCTNAMVTTKKTCLACESGLIRQAYPYEPRPVAWIDAKNRRLFL